MKILIAEPDNFSEEALALASSTGQVDLRKITPDELPWAFENYDVFWCRLGFQITEDLLHLPGRRVETIVCPVTGLDHIDLEACQKNGVKVISLKGEVEFLKSIRATAELTIGLTLALLRRIPEAVESVKAGIWNRELFKGSEILGKTVGIIGMGRLGTIVAQYFQAFGSHVMGYDVKDFEVPHVKKTSSLEEIVGASDIISLHANYGPSNHHLINADLLSRFKKGSILINTSRGGLVDEEALMFSLENGKLAGAAVDVIENEYYFKESLLVQYAREHNNLLITPHIGGNTWESFAKTEEFVAQKLINTLENE